MRRKVAASRRSSRPTPRRRPPRPSRRTPLTQADCSSSEWSRCQRRMWCSMCRRSYQCARSTPGTGESANHCAQDAWSSIRSTASLDSPSSTTGRPGRSSASTQRRVALLQGVQEDAVGTELGDQRGQLSASDRAGAAGADVPWVVVDEHPHARAVQARRPGPASRARLGRSPTGCAGRGRSPGRRATARPRRGRRSRRSRVGEEPFGGETAAVVVVEQLVPQPHQGDGARPRRPTRDSGLVGSGSPCSRAGSRASSRQRRSAPPGGPVGRVGGPSEDLRLVQHGQVGVGIRAAPASAGRSAAGPADRDAAVIDAVTSAIGPRAARSSKLMPPKPGRRGRDPLVAAASIHCGRAAPHAPVSAPRPSRPSRRSESVSQPPMTTAMDRRPELAAAARQRERDDRRVVEHVHPVQVAVLGMDPVQASAPRRSPSTAAELRPAPHGGGQPAPGGTTARPASSTSSTVADHHGRGAAPPRTSPRTRRCAVWLSRASGQASRAAPRRIARRAQPTRRRGSARRSTRGTGCVASRSPARAWPPACCGTRRARR